MGSSVDSRPNIDYTLVELYNRQVNRLSVKDMGRASAVAVIWVLASFIRYYMIRSSLRCWRCLLV